MNREFSVNAVILIMVNFLIKPIYIFFVEAGVQNLTGPHEYGQYFILFDFAFLFLVINDAGIQNFNSRFIAQNKDNLGDYFGKILGFKLVAGLAFAVVTFSVGWLLGYVGDGQQMLILIVFAFFLNSVFVLLRSSLSALGYYRWDSWLSSLDKVLLLIGLGYLVIRGYSGNGFEIEWFPLAQVIAAIIACLIAAILLQKVNLKIKFSLDFKSFKQMVGSTYPYALILLFSAAYNRADAVMLDLLLPYDEGDFEAGIYAAAYRLLDAGNMVGFLFASLLLPMFSTMIKENKEVKSLFQLGFKGLFIIGLSGAIICRFYSGELYNLLYVEVYQNQDHLLSTLMLSFIPICLAHCFGSFLIADGKLKAINLIFLIGLTINLIGNAWVIPTMKAEGAAYVTVGTQWFLLIGMATYLGITRPEFKIFKLILGAVSIMILGVGMAIAFQSISTFWVIEVLVLGTLILIMAFGSKWIEAKDIRK